MQPSERPEEIIGQRVRHLRQEHGWSQDGLAERMTREGFSWGQTTVARTEGASRPLRVDEMVALAQVLGVAVPDVLRAHVGDEEQAMRQRLLRTREAFYRTQSDIQQLERQQQETAAEIVRLQERRAELETATGHLHKQLAELRNREDNDG